MVLLPITLSTVLGSSLLVAIFFNSVLVSQFMSVEDVDMPIKKIATLTGVMTLLGIIVLITGGAYSALGSLMIFTAIMLWVYRLFLRGWANSFQNKVLPRLESWYETRLRNALSGKTPYVLVTLTFVLLIASFITFGWSLGTQRTKVEFFPDNKPNQIIVYIEYPEGTDIEKTNSITKLIEEKVADVLYGDEYMDGDHNFMVESLVSQVGEGAGNPQTDGGSAAEMPHKGKVTASMREYKYRKGLDSELMRQKVQTALVGIYPGVLISVEKDANGPPVGSPINIEIEGDDYAELIHTAQSCLLYTSPSPRDRG